MSFATEPADQPQVSRALQPALHDVITCLQATTVALSHDDGQIESTGALGLYCGDVRVLAHAVVTVDGSRPEAIGFSADSASQVTFVGVLRHLGDPGPDPTVWLRRRRQISGDSMAESLTLDNASGLELRVTIETAVQSDLGRIDEIKGGIAQTLRPFEMRADELVVTGSAVTLHISGPDALVDTTGIGSIADHTHHDTSHGRLWWDVVVAPHSSATVEWSASMSDTASVVVAARQEPTWSTPAVRAGDWRLAPWVERSVSDLAALRVALSSSPDNEFLAAGSPWYLTLFGRDSIWAARMLLPLGTDLARGTLQALASLQGTVADSETAEEPGKILHELRRNQPPSAGSSLPPAYYGTIDATPLWVCLLADAWRWGMAGDAVEELLPAAERALAWMRDSGDEDGDGFLEYIDRSGRGLANQGWKDSHDSIRNRDGGIAEGPIALAEVQAYAFEAAIGGAELLDAFGRPGGDEWRAYASGMADRFRQQFWVDDADGRFPAVALDGHKRPVSTVASNMGHLLGTGIVDAAEARLIADRLTDPTMATGFGLRTMSSAAAGYSPLSYHCGSVWPHDTAIAIHGLAREGLAAHASILSHQLATAGAAFGYRLPELFGGFSIDEFEAPLPYPASCRPQAWAAAAAIVVLRAALGLEPDVPAGVCQLLPTPTFGTLDVVGLQLAGQPIAVSTDAAGDVVSSSLPPGVAATQRLKHTPR